MQKLSLLIFWMAFSCQAFAGDDIYSVATIPAALLKDASVVKRMELVRFEISLTNEASLTYKVAYTILNEQGDRWALFQVGYDKLRTVSTFTGTLYDASGKKLKSLKKSDIKDESGMDDVSLADDNRVKWHDFFYKGYPYTVEYEMVMNYKGTMFLPSWTPQEIYNMSVQHSLLQVVCPASNPLHYKTFMYNPPPVITADKGNKIYQWEVKDLQTKESEFASPAWYKLTPSVFLTTERFTLENYQGSNASWRDFGKFVYDLKANRDALPADVKQKVHDLTAGLKTNMEKITVLYKYLQQHTRYISIQLGVGGWRPFDAKFVVEKKYGDCKALTNFMYALLKEAGISSLYTVIRAGEDKDYLIKELPGPQFNHVILMVPNGKDTVWLECTSQTLAAGYLSNFTADRLALAVDEAGGKLVHTPKYDYKENLQVRKIKASINQEGTLDATITTDYQAEQQDRIHQLINGLSKDKLMEFLKEDIDLPTYDIRHFNYVEIKSELPVVQEQLELDASNYAISSGKRLFILPNIISRSQRVLNEMKERKYDIELGMAYTDIDTSSITIPDGYTMEAIPAEIDLHTKFGNYQARVKLEGNTISYIRHFECFTGTFPAADYEALRQFYDKVYKADRSKVVLVKNQ